jgi:hypothetical protein
MIGHARLLGIVTLVAGMAALWPPEAPGYNSGAPDNPNCNTCHIGGTVPSVNFLSNNAAVTALAVPRGSTVQLTLRVKSNSPAQRSAGFNVTSSNSAVTLGPSAGPGEKIIPPGELTQTSRRANNANGIADFTFNITAQAATTCGTVSTLKGQGLSVSGNGGVSGARAASATLVVTVTCP